MKPSKEQIDTLWHQCTQESVERGEMFTRYAFYDRAYAAGRKAAFLEALLIARNKAEELELSGDIEESEGAHQTADAIRAAMEADK